MGVQETGLETRTGRFLHYLVKTETGRNSLYCPDIMKIIFAHKTTKQKLIKKPRAMIFVLSRIKVIAKQLFVCFNCYT